VAIPNQPLYDEANNKLVIGNLAWEQGIHWYDMYFDGLIDEVRIYDKALTEAEIAGVMAGGTAIADYHPVASPMNLTDPEAAGSRGVNFADFAVFMNEWAEEQLWP